MELDRGQDGTDRGKQNLLFLHQMRFEFGPQRIEGVSQRIEHRAVPAAVGVLYLSQQRIDSIQLRSGKGVVRVENVVGKDGERDYGPVGCGCGRLLPEQSLL